MSKTATYSLIASTTLGSNQASYSFTSIPSTYTDLVLVAMVFNSVGSFYETQVQVNGDTGTNYSYTSLYGDGSATASGRNSNGNRIPVGWNTNTVMVPTIINFEDYANTTTYKTVLARSSDSNNRVSANVGLWRNTAAINRIDINCEAGANWKSGSTFKLYGIQAGSN
jgi:hypothetical protein